MFHERGWRAARCLMQENPIGERAAASTEKGGGAAVSTATLDLLECAPRQRPLLDEVLDGLGGTEKSLPAKLHYDQRGSLLFERICRCSRS